MKNKLPKKDKGLGFLRHWKVMTMTLLLLTFSIGQMWGQDVTLADINYTQWDGTAMPANSGLSNSNTYYASNGTSRVATLVGKGCKLDDSSNLPTATGVSGSYEHYLRFGSSGNYLNITASNDLVKNAGETSYGKVRFLVSSQKNKTTDELAEVKIGETSLGKIYAFTSTSTCDWVEFDIPATVSKNATITLTRTTNTLFVWGIQIKTFTSSSSPVSVTGITLAPSSATIKVGKTVTLVPTITPSDATDKAVTWAVTSGSSYASVTDAGVVTGLAAGTAVVTATAHDGSGVTQTATITVEDCPTSGTLFSMTITDPDGTVYTDVTNAAPQLIGATYVGGKAYATSTSSSKRSPKITGDEFDFNVSSSSSVAVKVELDCPLAEGDIISFTSTHTKEFKIQKVAGTNLHQTSSLSLAIPSGSSLIDEDVFYVLCANSACSFSEINIIRPIYRTITLEYADGETPDGSLEVVDGTAATKPADPTWAHHRFDGWYDGSDPYDWSETVGGDLTLTAHWTQLYTITFANGGGTGDAPAAVADKAQGETFSVPANTFTPPTGQVFDHWNDGTNDYNQGDTYTVGTNNVTLTAVWRTPSTMYAITKGAHENGDFTIDPASQEAGEVVTLEATPNDGYLFGSWEVVKTEDASATGITVDANGQFTMPGYAVTVNATFVADTRQKVLYVTATAEATVKANDKLYAALKDIYNVKIVGSNSDEDQTGYDLIVLHESVGGSDYNKTAVATAKAGNKPVLNTKSYFYNNANTTDQRWNWGTPNAGKSVKGATQNSAYCNIADHPLFAGVTVTDGFFEITDAEAAKCMQPVKTFTTGKEGYTLATTPNNDSGNGTAIHELTPAQRGASAGKYLMISVSNAKLDALNANGQKLFQNAADYLINGTAWEPIVAPTSATIEANGGAAHIVGDEVTLTASATGVSASTLYSWYKGATLEAAQEAGAIQTAETAANNGHKYTIASCELASAGTYWCVITNAVACEASASLELTVSDASYVITFASAHGTAPTATTGVAYTLPELTESGWAHQGWTASIDVTVDAATVEAGTLIANSKMATFGADVTFTAVWAQEFQVTFNLNGHGDPIAAQIVVDGELATDPGNPSEIGYDFGGWFTDEDCTVGNEFDFATPITATTPLFAKWTAFAGCVLLVPATSGDAPAVGDPISMQSGSKGGSMSVIGTPLSYNTYGLGFDSNSSAKAKVTINNEIQEGTVISLTLVANGTSAPRGLHLYSGDGATKIASIGWTSTVVKYTEETFTYTVQSTDVALIGTNEFQLWRNSSVFLKQLAITNCGDPIIYHNLTSEIAPDHDPAYATVTLGASSVREGRTTTATYSDIVSGYEFDEWQISGTGASIADASANPAVITMGTADAVVTLKLKAETPSHTVTFNKMGKGADIAPQSVKEGAKVSEPSVTEPEGYLLEGWYKESTLENKWDFASDVMGTSNIELFANWVADPSIRLINKSTGAINTTNFTTGVTETEANSEKAAAWGGTQGAISGTNAMGKIVQYNAATNQMKIKISAYNTNGSGKEIYIHRILEGEDTEQAVETLAVASNTPVESEYYTFNNTKNRSFYLTTNSTDVKLLQVRVIDDGTAIKQAGQAGYSVNLNKGRLLGPKDTDLSFEGLTCNLSSNYSVINSTEAKLKNDGRSISFTVAAALTLQVTTTNAATYYVTKDAAGTSNETAVAGVSEFDLTAGTWFISAGSSEVKFTKLEFIAPKCAEPAFNSLANSDICSGDLYVALNGTATVADAGVPTYQWYREDNSAIDGETNATYTPSADGKYYVIAVNHLAGFSNNEKKSALVTVTTHAGTAITTGLAHVRKTVGEDATLTVEAEGKNLHYAWKECETIDGSYTDVAGAADNKSLDVVVPDGVKYYKVIVSSDCGDDQESIAKVEKFVELPQLHITGSTTWDLTTCADAEIKLGDTTSPKKGEECLMANIEGVHLDANFNSQALVMSGEYIYRNVTGKPTCAEYMKFITDVEGVVTITFAGNGSNRLIRVTGTNGVQYSTVSSGTGDTHTEKFFVTPGEVELMGMDQALTQDKRYMRFFSISFNATPEYTRPVTEGRFGTICLPNGGVMVGAALFEVAYHDATLEKIFFDEILNGAMVAGRPYIFLPNDGVSELGVFYTDAADASAGNYHGLYGSYTQEVLAKEAGNYILYNNQYMYVGASSTNVSVGANRAYFKIGVEGGIPTNAVAPLPGRRRVSMSAVRETPTGLENGELINGENGVQKVLINGELFILRGEKMYDATGRLVK